MTLFELFSSLKTDIPRAFGVFHISWIILIVLLTILFIKKKNKINEKLVYGLYGFGSLIFEIIKQYMWNFDIVNGEMIFGYRWFIFPFQLCSTPMYVAIILFFIKDGNLKKSLINYLCYFTTLSAIAVMVYPTQVLCEYTLVNIQTMYLHAGSLVLSMYLIINNKVDKSLKGLLHGTTIFIIVVALALILNITVYNFFNLANEPAQSFDMFYISPYYETLMPVFSKLQKLLPYPLYLLTYILVLVLGAFIVNRIINLRYKKS